MTCKIEPEFLEMARKVSNRDVPTSLRCKACDLVALQAVHLPCCHQTICGMCKNAPKTWCPGCGQFSPRTQVCEPNEGLRLEVEEFLKTYGQDTERKMATAGPFGFPVRSGVPSVGQAAGSVPVLKPVSRRKPVAGSSSVGPAPASASSTSSSMPTPNPKTVPSETSAPGISNAEQVPGASMASNFTSVGKTLPSTRIFKALSADAPSATPAKAQPAPNAVQTQGPAATFESLPNVPKFTFTFEYKKPSTNQKTRRRKAGGQLASDAQSEQRFPVTSGFVPASTSTVFNFRSDNPSKDQATGPQAIMHSSRNAAAKPRVAPAFSLPPSGAPPTFTFDFKAPTTDSGSTVVAANGAPKAQAAVEKQPKIALLSLPNELLDIIFDYAYPPEPNTEFIARTAWGSQERKLRREAPKTYEMRAFPPPKVESFMVSKCFFIAAARAWCGNQVYEVDRSIGAEFWGERTTLYEHGVLHAFTTHATASLPYLFRSVLAIPSLTNLELSVSPQLFESIEPKFPWIDELDEQDLLKVIEGSKLRQLPCLRRLSLAPQRCPYAKSKAEVATWETNVAKLEQIARRMVPRTKDSVDVGQGLLYPGSKVSVGKREEKRPLPRPRQGLPFPQTPTAAASQGVRGLLAITATAITTLVKFDEQSALRLTQALSAQNAQLSLTTPGALQSISRTAEQTLQPPSDNATPANGTSAQQMDGAAMRMAQPAGVSVSAKLDQLMQSNEQEVLEWIRRLQLEDKATSKERGEARS